MGSPDVAAVAGATVPVRWGLLSTARINDAVLRGCEGSTLLDFVAVASRSAERAREWARSRNIATAYGAYQNLLDDPAVEAVYISLPNAMHVDWSIRALEAGKHVLCEKPLSRDRDAIALAFDASEKAGRLLVEAFMYRFHPQTAHIRNLIARGMIGPVQSLRASLSYDLSVRADADTNVRLSTQLDGGALMDTGCYCLNAFRLLVGEPRRVMAHAVRGPTGVDLACFAMLVSDDGRVGQFDCGMNVPPHDALEIVGRDGVIFSSDPWHCRGGPIAIRVGDRTEQIDLERTNDYRAEFEAVSLAIRGGTQPEFGRDDAIAQSVALDALRIAAETGTIIDVPSPSC